MEVEQSGEVLVSAKKLWKIVRAVILMIRKGISKKRILTDINLMFQRGKLSMFHHHFSPTSLSCRSDEALSFISPVPREYEFSCSNSPAFNTSAKRKHRRLQHHYNLAMSYRYQDVPDSTLAAVHKVLEIFNSNIETVEASHSPLTLFGRSPMVRQLRITDSPFPLKDDDGDRQVDKDAEEFIHKFYKQLMLQRS